MSFAAYSLWMLGHKRLINSSWVAWVRLCEAENAETPSDPWIHLNDLPNQRHNLVLGPQCFFCF